MNEQVMNFKKGRSQEERGRGRDLGQDLGHGIRGLAVPCTQDAQQVQDLHLQEGVRHAADLMLQCVSGQQQVLHDADQVRNVLCSEGWGGVT